MHSESDFQPILITPMAAAQDKAKVTAHLDYSSKLYFRPLFSSQKPERSSETWARS